MNPNDLPAPYLYKASASRDGSIDPDKITESEARETLDRAMADAHTLAPKNKTVTVLRAETSGINAGKFFLHLILK